jgi:hypothetical protein
MKTDGVYIHGHKLPKKNLSWKEYFGAYIFMHRKKFPDDATPWVGYEWSYTAKGAENIAKNHTPRGRYRYNKKYRVYVVYLRI